MAHPPELRQRAKKLRKQGLLIRVIAAELGVPKPTVIRWLNPKLEKRGQARARKLRFSQKRRCPQCGKRMVNSASLCLTCARASQRHWTRERIVAAIQQWAAVNGRAPVYEDWMRSGEGHPAIRSILDGPNPPFKSWSEMLLAAGFTPRQRRSPKGIADKRKRSAAQRREDRKNKLKRAMAKENTDEDQMEEIT